MMLTAAQIKKLTELSKTLIFLLVPAIVIIGSLYLLNRHGVLNIPMLGQTITEEICRQS